jgi:hypothetical protein
MRRSVVGIIVVAAVVAAQAVSAAEYYVSPGGSDSSPGTLALPWATIGHALGHLQAGDTLHVGAGSYSESNEISGLRGTAQAPITILGSGLPRITATGRDVFLIWNASSYVTIDGLELTGGTRSGSIVNGSTYIAFRNCLIHDNGTWGVQTVLSDHITVEDCEICNSGTQHGIYFSTTDHPSAIGNVIHDCPGCGVHMNGDISEGGDGMITGATIEGNTIYNCGAGGGAAINMDSVEDSLVADNLLYDNLAGGITSFHQDGLAAGKNNEFYFNTVYFAPGTGRYALQLYAGSTNATVADNIFVCSKLALDIDSASMAGLASDYNILCRPGSDAPIGGDAYCTLPQWQAATGNDEHSLTSAPDFVDAVSDDFHLAADSAGVDAGVAVPGITADIGGTARPQGAAVDMGAYERAGSAPPTVPAWGVHVQSITLQVNGKGRRRAAQAVVVVVEEGGTPMKKVTVVGAWALNGQSIGKAVHSKTNGRGQASLRSPKAEAESGDTFTFVLTGLTCKDYPYDPDADEVEAASVAVP